MREKKYSRSSAVGTKSFGFKMALLWIKTAIHSFVFPPRLEVRLSGGDKVYYPAMTRREIRKVAEAICLSAVGDVPRR